MIVAFDLDGVLRDIMSPFAESHGLEVEDLTHYTKPIELAGGISKLLDELDDLDVWSVAKPHLPILGAYKLLQDEGVKTPIVSVVNRPRARADSVLWLADQGILEPEIHFVRDKLQVSWDVIVEDNPIDAVKFLEAGRRVFLVPRPWTVKVVVPGADRIMPDADGGWTGGISFFNQLARMFLEKRRDQAARGGA